MKTTIGTILACLLLMSGCGREPVVQEAPAAPPSGVEMVPGVGATLPTPLPMAAGTAKLDANNSTIVFIGTHAGGEPNPRTGTFSEFSGTVQLQPQSKALESITVEIQAGSLTTDFEKLTTHLKSPDFLNVREHPTITFTSTDIAADESKPNSYVVTGDLTLHGVTKEIQFPADVDATGDALLLRSEFVIDRTAFGMDFGTDSVEKDVTIKVTVGQRTAKLSMEALQGPSDPEARFRQRDANSDGKLAGDEISERMRENLDATDTDGDGAVSLAEFQARVRQRQGGTAASGANEAETAPAN